MPGEPRRIVLIRARHRSNPGSANTRLSFEGAFPSDSQYEIYVVDRWNTISADGIESESIADLIGDAYLIVADLADGDRSIYFWLGVARAMRKPTLTFATVDAQLSNELLEVPVIFYDPAEILETGGLAIAQRAIARALASPADLLPKKSAPAVRKNSVFISYSHKDREYLARLLVHLRPLERAGLIGLWADTAMSGGELWRDEIAAALNEARIAVLLVSPDFLDSEFILNNELPELLLAAQSKGTYILPVIVSPCRFARDNMLSQFQAVNDPAQPIASLAKPLQEAVYDKVAEKIEKMVTR